MNEPEVVYIVEWFGRGGSKLSQNITKDKEGLQKYIDKMFIKRNNNVAISGNSPDCFEAYDINDGSGIRIFSRPVIDKFEHIDLLRINALPF